MSIGHNKHPWRLAIAIISLALVLGLSPMPAANSQAPGYVDVSAGSFHTCAIREHNNSTAGGEAECWGRNDDGQATAPAGEFTQITAGGRHTCGLQPDGHVVCWGSNRVFLCFDGFSSSYYNSMQATPPAGVLFTQVSAGLYHTCGVTLDGSIDCWGYNVAGEATDHAGSYLRVSAGEYHTCGLRSDKQIQCWGLNDHGRTENPVGEFTDVSAGGSHNCAVRVDRTAACWGGDWYGQSSPPNAYFLAATAGNLHSCGLTSAHALRCWGYNFYGQVRQAPQGSFTQVSSGEGHSCAITDTNEVYCWGRNDFGQATVPALGGPAVHFEFGGFYPPVEPEPVLNRVKAGSAVPLKFSLGGDWGLNVIDLGAPTSGPLDCNLLDPSGEFEPVQSAGAGLTYDPVSDQYTYVWKTQKAWAGTCRILSLQLVDGTEQRAAFRFK